jgi:hypothetical protein
VVIAQRDCPELKEHWPFLWFENGFTVLGQSIKVGETKPLWLRGYCCAVSEAG